MKDSNPIRIVGALLFLPFWHLIGLLPRDRRIWLFGSWFGTKYSDNSRAVYEYVFSNRPDIRPVWITRSLSVRDRLASEGKPAEYYHSIKGIWYCLRAGAVFITTTPDETNAKLLNGAYMVWLWHGVGLKYIMADELRWKWRRYSSWKKFKVRINRFLFPYRDTPHKDCLANTSDFFTPFFCSGFELPPEKVWVKGYPRNDMFFKEGHENMILRYRELFPTAKFIIYMPTHRVNARNGIPFNGFEGFGFDAKAFFETLEKGDFVFFNKGHFFDSCAKIEMAGERFVNLTDSDYDDLYSFIKDTDILITDFSSIYFDYLLLRKPIILSPFDYDDYIARERGLQFDYNEQEAVQARDWPSLLRILNEGLYFTPSEDNLKKFHKYTDGYSCRRYADRISEILFNKDDAFAKETENR